MVKNWLSKNKKWFFSGAGVALISAAITILLSLSRGNRVSDQPKILPQTSPPSLPSETNNDQSNQDSLSQLAGDSSNNFQFSDLDGDIIFKIPPTLIPIPEEGVDARNIFPDECKVTQNLIDDFTEGIYNYQQGKSIPDPLEVGKDYGGRSRQEYNCFYWGHISASFGSSDPTPIPIPEENFDTSNVSSDECKVTQNLVDAFAEGVHNYRQGKRTPDPLVVAKDYGGRSRQEYDCFYLGHINASLFIVR